MTTTADTHEALSLVADIFGPATVNVMYDNLSYGQRLGQAFMNALDEECYTTLTGSLADPFYRDTLESVIRALDFLTRRPGG